MKYSSPTYVPIELTGKCNLKCKHCYGNFPRYEDNEMTTKEIFTLINQLYNLGVFRFELGGGEPTLRDDFLSIIKHIDKYRDINVSIVTNGILWNEKMIYELSKLKGNKKYVHISMDGYDEETYSFLRNNKTAFNKAIETSKMMVEYGIEVAWNFAVGKETYSYLPKVLELAKEIGIPHVRLMVLYNTGRAIEDNVGFNYEEFQNFMIDYIERLVVKSPVPISLALTQPFEFFVPLLEVGYSKEEILKKIPYAVDNLSDEYYNKQTNLSCPGGRMLGAIDSIGNMYFCCILTGIPEFVGGNIFNKNIKEIWDNSPIFNWIRSIRLEDLKTDCVECKYNSLCGGGCRARAYFYSGDILGADPLCPFVKKKDKISLETPIVTREKIEFPREVKKFELSNAFSVNIKGRFIRIRKEESGGSAFIPYDTFLNINRSGYMILRLLYETKDYEKVIKIISEKYKISNDKSRDIISKYLEKFSTIDA